MNDEVYTPKNIVIKIFSLLDDNFKNNNSFWFPFDTKESEFVKYAKYNNLTFFNTHIFNSYEEDFFKFLPTFYNYVVISNPPFSKQNLVLQRLFYLYENKFINSFILLLPLSCLETEFRSNLLDKYKSFLHVIVFKKRIKFVNYSTSFNNACCLLCFNIFEKGLSFI